VSAGDRSSPGLAAGVEGQRLRRQQAVGLAGRGVVDLPTDDAAFRAKIEEERASADDGRGPFFQLVYNQQHAPAANWFGERDWTAVATPLSDYLTALGRPLPAPDSEAAPMVSSISLVSARRN
jgi:hypothetical protein